MAEASHAATWKIPDPFHADMITVIIPYIHLTTHHPAVLHLLHITQQSPSYYTSCYSPSILLHISLHILHSILYITLHLYITLQSSNMCPDLDWMLGRCPHIAHADLFVVLHCAPGSMIEALAAKLRVGDPPLMPPQSELCIHRCVLCSVYVVCLSLSSHAATV